MKSIVISKADFEKLAQITKKSPNREVCALLFSKTTQAGFLLESIIEVRNTHRTSTSFGISKMDFEKHHTSSLIGLYHSHLFTNTLSEKDKLIFRNRTEIQFQLIGLTDDRKDVFNLYGFTNTLNNLKITIL